MKTAIGVGGPASGQRRNFEDVVAFAVEAEKLGVDVAWSCRGLGAGCGIATRVRSGADDAACTLGTGNHADQRPGSEQ